MQALGYFDKAKRITQLEYNSEDYLRDALQAVCLLVEDGLMIVFPHRSFQEYFTARFIAETKPNIHKRLVEKYSKNVSADDVMRLLYEIKPDVVEQYYIIPGIAKIGQLIKYKSKVGLTHYYNLLTEILEGIGCYEIEGDLLLDVQFKGNIKVNFFLDIMMFTKLNYGHLIGWKDWVDDRSVILLKLKKFFEKYKISPNTIVKLKDFKPRSQFMRDFGDIEGFFSIETLRKLFEVGEVIKTKRKNAEASLAKILG
jgi:hypothetical protein